MIDYKIEHTKSKGRNLTITILYFINSMVYVAIDENGISAESRISRKQAIINYNKKIKYMGMKS